MGRSARAVGWGRPWPCCPRRRVWTGPRHAALAARRPSSLVVSHVGRASGSLQHPLRHPPAACGTPWTLNPKPQAPTPTAAVPSRHAGRPGARAGGAPSLAAQQQQRGGRRTRGQRRGGARRGHISQRVRRSAPHCTARAAPATCTRRPHWVLCCDVDVILSAGRCLLQCRAATATAYVCFCRALCSC